VSRAIYVVSLSGITLLDVLRLLKDLLGWIATLARAVEAIGFNVSMAKLLNSCVVGYCRDLVVVFYGEGAANKLPEWFEPLVLPPTLLVDCRVAKVVVAYAKNLCEDLVKRLEYEDPLAAHALRYDVEGLEVIRVRELYHPKKLIKVFKLFIFMKHLRNFTIDGVDIYDVMVVNWRKLEERTAWGVLARA